jgi:hypothetical protein
MLRTQLRFSHFWITCARAAAVSMMVDACTVGNTVRFMCVVHIFEHTLPSIQCHSALSYLWLGVCLFLREVSSGE